MDRFDQIQNKLARALENEIDATNSDYVLDVSFLLQEIKYLREKVVQKGEKILTFSRNGHTQNVSHEELFSNGKSDN